MRRSRPARGGPWPPQLEVLRTSSWMKNRLRGEDAGKARVLFCDLGAPAWVSVWFKRLNLDAIPGRR
jgi:hypothetical protein